MTRHVSTYDPTRDDLACLPGSDVNLVFEGGGMKGIGLVGALAEFEARGFQIGHVAGASAGSIVATLLAAGYNAADLLRIAVETDFRDFKDTEWLDRAPVIGPLISIVRDKGIYEGHAFEHRMRELLAAKGVQRFGDLISPAAHPAPVYRHRAQVIVSDLTERRLLVLPRDARHLGIDPDELDVALAVRMSVSIPVFFEPVRFLNPRTGREHLLVDGGLLSNFPVWLFDSDHTATCPTIGLRLDEDADGDHQERQRQGNLSVLGFFRRLGETMLSAHDDHYLESRGFERTIRVPTLGVGFTDFELSQERVDQLYQAGRSAAATFLDQWTARRLAGVTRDGEPCATPAGHPLEHLSARTEARYAAAAR